MFGILKRWRERRRKSERMLYSYWDGEKTRHGDPYRIWRDMTYNGRVDLAAVAPLVDAGSEPETTQVIEVIAAAFKVRRWDDGMQTGMTDWEILQLMWELESWMAALKKNISPGPTSPEPTDAKSSSLPEHPSETTNASSDSGKTDDASTTNGPCNCSSHCETASPMTSP